MKKAFDSIKRGLTEAIAHQKGRAKSVKVHASVEVDVLALRKRIGLSQQDSRGHRNRPDHLLA